MEIATQITWAQARVGVRIAIYTKKNGKAMYLC